MRGFAVVAYIIGARVFVVVRKILGIGQRAFVTAAIAHKNPAVAFLLLGIGDDGICRGVNQHAAPIIAGGDGATIGCGRAAHIAFAGQQRTLGILMFGREAGPA